ncbi:MAG TPA: isoprenyl transferase [Myxococcota bacterium]|jgi:undecaprenyl diphosphate synthase|nr:isoprenyl transferase [Myxococcota bacterium]
MHERRIRSDALPRHVAVIMDGNGRWAERRGLDRIEGHRAGIEAVRAVVRAAHELGVRQLTLYAFSTENWSRPRGEVDELMRLLERYLESELEEVERNRIRVRAIGRLERLPDAARAKLDEALRRTRDNDEMDLVFALSYGGRTEIVDAARRLARDVEQGKLDPEAIDEKLFASCLYDPELSEPDLLIRTGGESRVSNFLLWQIAYAEIHVTEVMWPDFRKGDLVEAILAYQGRERRYGLTSAQVRTRPEPGS